MCRSQALSIKPLLVSAMFQVDPDVGFLSPVAHKLAMDLVGAVRRMFHVEQGAWILRWRRGTRAGCAGRRGCWRSTRTGRPDFWREGRRTFHVDPPCGSAPGGPWMFVGSKYSDTAGPVRRIVQRGAGCLDLGWLTVETERLVWAGAGRGMFHVEPDGLVDTPQQGGRMFHVEQRRAAPGEPLSDRTADGQRFRGREVGAAPESGYHQG